MLFFFLSPRRLCEWMKWTTTTKNQRIRLETVCAKEIFLSRHNTYEWCVPFDGFWWVFECVCVRAYASPSLQLEIENDNLTRLRQIEVHWRESNWIYSICINLVICRLFNACARFIEGLYNTLKFISSKQSKK